MDNTVFKKEAEFIKSIHLNSEKKLSELKELTGMDKIDFDSLNDIELLTSFLMKKAKKSDNNFLMWMCAVGSHIKRRYNGKWVLVHYSNFLFDIYMPAIVNADNDIWEVGNFCYRYYYAYRRMSGMSFMFFYKLDIERVALKLKYSDLNKPEEDFIFLEN